MIASASFGGGSSRYFLGGAVVYSKRPEDLVCRRASVDDEAHGAVSKEVAVALADNIARYATPTLRWRDRNSGAGRAERKRNRLGLV